ncbi:MAG: polyphenol oxidase family protein [candidate division WOR-3 bacterium]
MWELKEKDGLKYFNLKSEFPIRLIFTTRQGGFSQGEYKSFNLSFEVGEEKKVVEKNYQKLKEVLGTKKIITLKQTHSDKIVFVKGETFEEGDALLTKEKGLYLGVKVADCLAVAFFNKKSDLIGIAHFGWRNLLLGFPKKICQILKEMTDSPLFYLLFPSIRGECYETGEEVFSAFQKAYPENYQEFLWDKASRYYLDLRGLARSLLAGEGLKEYSSLEYCVHCQGDLFYSKRRDGKTGRNLALIGLQV